MKFFEHSTRRAEIIDLRHDARMGVWGGFTKDARRIQGLDMLRGVAVALVMLRHAWPDTFDGAGIVGVAIFFTLSGYLITGLIVREIERTGTLRKARFFRNRALRLFPAIAALFVVYAVVEITFGPGGDSNETIGKTVLIGATYTANLPLGISPTLGHIWSLATEEQFYLVWPFLILFTRRWLRPVVICLLVTAWLTVLCWSSLLIVNNASSIYALPTTWGSALAFGGIGYTLRNRISAHLGRRLSTVAAIGAIVLLVLSFVPDAKTAAATYILWPTLIAAASLAVIFVVAQWEILPSSALAPLLWLGEISYGVYLWNLPVNVWLTAALGGDLAGWKWVTIPMTIAAALVSWYTVELVGRHYRDRFDSRQSPPPLISDIHTPRKSSLFGIPKDGTATGTSERV
ncbi:acyltransferase [Rhodococcus sp. BP-349]|uniref:acyltransferase family protein n=1 Tax=unclassified Rhodococcus (in: high G+C Gram-positive bacteria) TaxID=192944 RepID=UPI001C9B60E7|nr:MULTISPECIES: acyltransferase [unclassified Rhodococcus (in: high G+C Gram-positive bacteria)]MBY6539491.1 acyltransferase [Rhodococcus sp. BP-363]MBY6544181.1 acyltransferase [Rhodococcus sp. BP-369]MBY6563411.1 acyltransferase [Rhodococcus sp. BP-370]MBY6577703.1 acyltransferase [Rhodococcus sp. BP-364]MBY6587004.1 acyltransferase [Rhodococcus sp. BP-358]